MPLLPAESSAPTSPPTSQDFARTGDYRKFEQQVVNPWHQQLDAVLDQALPYHAKAQFLLKNGAFVRAQLMELFERFEGSGHVAGKAEWVFDRLLQYFLCKAPIVRHLEGVAGTAFYCLPQRILLDQASVLKAFKAIEQLYFGQAFSYLAWVTSLAHALAPGELAEQARNVAH